MRQDKAESARRARSFGLSAKTRRGEVRSEEGETVSRAYRSSITQSEPLFLCSAVAPARLCADLSSETRGRTRVFVELETKVVVDAAARKLTRRDRELSLVFAHLQEIRVERLLVLTPDADVGAVVVGAGAAAAIIDVGQSAGPRVLSFIRKSA